jgi:hypothetical protein
MAAREGIFWFNGPNEFAQKLSIAEEALEGKAEQVVKELVDEAERRMEQIIRDGGIYKTKKGGARMLTTDMYQSVGSSVAINNRGRVQAEFGFIDNAPFYTKFQERGTRGSGPLRSSGGGGIAPMLAYATALGEAIVEFQNKIDSVQWFATSQMSWVR